MSKGKDTKKKTVTRTRGYRYRLYPSETQNIALLASGHNTRALWNLLHAWWTVVADNRFPTTDIIEKTIREARTQDYPWLKALSAQSCQAVRKQYVDAWYKHKKDPKNVGKPKYKPRSNTLSFTIPQGRDLNVSKVSQKWSTVQIPLVGRVQFRQHRAIRGTIKNATVVKEADGLWYISFTTEEERPVPNQKKRYARPTVGVDRGIVVPLQYSDGTTVKHGEWLTPKEQERLIRLQRQSARQRDARHAKDKARAEQAKKLKLGVPEKLRQSHNEKETYRQIAKLYATVRHRRDHWLHITSYHTANDYSITGLESLLIKNMTKAPTPKPDPEKPGSFLPNGKAAKAGLNKTILNESWGTFHKYVMYKAEERGGHVVTVPAPNTSTRCHKCRTIIRESRESQAVFKCKNPHCGWEGNADDNASKNVEQDMLQTVYATSTDETTLNVALFRIVVRENKKYNKTNKLSKAVKQSVVSSDTKTVTLADGLAVAALSGYEPRTTIVVLSPEVTKGMETRIKEGSPQLTQHVHLNVAKLEVTPETSAF